MRNIGKKGQFIAPVGESVQTLQPEAKPKKKAFQRTELEEYMYLQPDEIRSFFNVIDSRRDRAIFRITYHHGLRAHEVGLLQMSDYRDRDGLLYIRRGKGSISREHRLIPEELKALRGYIKFERGTMPGPLFPSRQGRRGITPSRLDQIIKGYCHDAGIRREKAHMHALKHSCGTHLAERDNSAAAIQDWLGHRDSKSTDIYMHFSKRRRDESVEKNSDWV